MKILVTGGTGFIGRPLVTHLSEAGHDCTVLVRRDLRMEEMLPCARYVPYARLDQIPAADAVINLAGEWIVGRWTDEKKRRILDSRVDVTRRLVRWMEGLPRRPEVFLSGSAVGIYGHRPGEILTETSSLDPAREFRYRVCQAWEDEARQAEALGVRTVLLRIGNVVDPHGGAIGLARRWTRWAPFLMPFAPRSMNPWIALPDAIRLLEFALTCPAIRGPLNVVAPQPATLRELTQALGHAMGRPVFGRLPTLLLRLAFGEFARALTDSLDVRPQVASAHGFAFAHPELRAFLRP
jgi:uncharacterized protein (TIGR01777 family)